MLPPAPAPSAHPIRVHEPASDSVDVVGGFDVGVARDFIRMAIEEGTDRGEDRLGGFEVGLTVGTAQCGRDQGLEFTVESHGVSSVPSAGSIRPPRRAEK
jgi:hypothetical protein